jgi:hypothetical protein
VRDEGVLRRSNGIAVICYYNSVALNFSLKVPSLLELANSCCAFYIFFFVLELLIHAFKLNCYHLVLVRWDIELDAIL